MVLFFEITNEEKNRLKQFSGDKNTIFALKKLFLNVCIKDPASNEAIKKILEAFHALNVINPDNQIYRGRIEENQV